MSDALDSMMGLIPTVIAGGVIMKVTDRMMGPESTYGRNLKNRYGSEEN